MVTIYRSVGSILQFTQTTGSNLKGAFATNELIMVQLTRASPLFVNVFNQLLIQQVVSGRRSLANLSVSHQLIIDSNAYRIKEGFASNLLNISHGCMRVQFSGALNFLQMFQEASGDATKPAENDLVIVDAAVANVERTLSINHNLTLQSNAVAYKYTDKFYAIPIVLPTPPGGDDGRCSD